jgi:hypothetical protein
MGPGETEGSRGRSGRFGEGSAAISAKLQDCESGRGRRGIHCIRLPGLGRYAERGRTWLPQYTFAPSARAPASAIDVAAQAPFAPADTAPNPAKSAEPRANAPFVEARGPEKVKSREKERPAPR